MQAELENRVRKRRHARIIGLCWHYQTITSLGEISCGHRRLVLRYGRTCEEVHGERYCELASKKIEHLHNVSTPCMNDQQFKDEELQTVGELSKVCFHISSCIAHI